MPSRSDAGTKAKAIRLVRDHAGDYDTEWAAIKAISGRLGMSAETLRRWLRQAEIDAGDRSVSAVSQRVTWSEVRSCGVPRPAKRLHPQRHHHPHRAPSTIWS